MVRLDLIQVHVKFSISEAEDFFGRYRALGPGTLPIQSVWFHPLYDFNCADISLDEVRKAIKHSKSSSTPSPHDQISYIILKRCPSLHDALLIYIKHVGRSVVCLSFGRWLLLN